jgi:uncharacterized protein YbdZ (MbtH family)
MTDEDPPKKSELPPGWDMKEGREGRFYFIDHNTKTTTWDDPREDATKEYLETLSGPLPAGWEKTETPDGRVYFQDHNNKVSTWVDPRMLIVKQVDHLKPLPKGWEMRINRRGTLYFINHNHKTTTWDDPREATETGEASDSAGILRAAEAAAASSPTQDASTLRSSDRPPAYRKPASTQDGGEPTSGAEASTSTGAEIASADRTTESGECGR